jgi:uncharacterized protein
MFNFCESALRRFILVILLLHCACNLTRAQDLCPHDSSEDTADGLIKALTRAKSCSAAAAKLHDCEWGSSADTEFAPIVITKCEKTFYDKLSPAGKYIYGEEMQLCSYEYARAQGTMSMSAAAMCQVDVAAEFAANPSLADRPAARASFDCAKAQSSLEKAICSNISLGHADIVLSLVYSSALKIDDTADKPLLIQSERKWLKSIPEKCALSAAPLSKYSLGCVRNEFELRFTALDSCGDGGEKITECIQVEADEGDQESSGAVSIGQRASFDCESPSTALEIVICADASLGQKDIKLAQAYHEAGTAIGAIQHKDLVESERKWLRFVNESCPLGTVGGIPPIMTRGCVRAAFKTRIAQLQNCPQRAPKERMTCLNDFQLFEKNQNDQ